MTQLCRLLIVIVAVALFLAIPLQRVAPAGAQEKVTALLAVGIQVAHIREFVAKQMGFWAEERLDVTLQPAQGSA